jgi:hypothetical protein
MEKAIKQESPDSEKCNLQLFKYGGIIIKGKLLELLSQ